MRFLGLLFASLLITTLLLGCSKSKRYAVTTDTPKDIRANKIIISGTAKGSFDKIAELGFCYSPDKIPTYNDKHVIANNNGLSPFTATVVDLSPNTGYNLRAYSKLTDGSIIYGNIVTSNTNGDYQLGDKGPGGGIIFYIDEFNPTGKYFEALILPGITASFGCSNKYLNTSMVSGYGKSNTNTILSTCGNNTAAFYCVNAGIKGLTDWYLPTANDMSYLLDFYQTNFLTYPTRTYWTSSEYSATSAYTYDFLGGWYDVSDKTEIHDVIAIRYFN
jgi:hypothetical protein